jgi:murein DD-endopeptidase MepM/ murein hydrolase activator NlpD
VKSEQKVISTKKELEAVREQLVNEWQDFHQRLREIYKNSQSDYLEIIFGARSLTDFVSRSFYFEKIIAKDIEFLNRVRLEQTQIDRKKKQLEEQTEQIRDLTKSIQLKKDQLQLEVSEKQKVHQSVQKMREEYERQVAELEEISRQIEALLRQGTEYQEAVAEATGQIIWPVPGRITSGFGYRRHPIFRVIKFHSGIDITCSYGYSIKAADGGVVVDARYWGGYGNVVILSHGSGLSTVYAHLSRFYVIRGQRIQKGQTLGLAGSTGYSTGPHVHFEVRKNGVPVNPGTYLP